MTCLLKLEPGAYVPFHKHPEVEQSFVLEGSVEDHDGVATAGDYIWRKPGSQHDNRSPNGAVLLAVYTKPNIYYHTGRATLASDCRAYRRTQGHFIPSRRREGGSELPAVPYCIERRCRQWPRYRA